MDKVLLKEAADSLVIQDVVLYGADIRVREGFSPFRQSVQSGIEVQFRHGADGVPEPYAIEADNAQLLDFHYSTGLRLVEKGEAVGDDEDAAVLVEIQAIFSAIYLITNPDVRSEALAEFARINVGYHVWPYWREYAASTLARMRLPAVVIPFYRTPASAEDPASSD